ncbi:MAG: cupin domain-containing protein [Oceanospirillaceae bacterium]|nr:cupin domain-containing protein [Oceanospirillaceae bacterium]
MSCVTKNKFKQPMDVAEVAEQWRKRGFSCDIYIDAPGQKWPNFIHSSNELVMVLEGQLKMLVADEAFIANPGDEVFIPSNTYHSLHNIDQGTTKWFYGYD